MANKLRHESSLYLRQHQNNPVHWYPWGEEALRKAQDENKLIIVSIGYSSCHWCHVMERESFENQPIARIMNEHFISVKVDREERPDVDQIYMTAVQLMTNAGGWPLNCICLPDGRPIYGGTYFTPEQWEAVLLQVQDMWIHSPETALDYARRLTTMVKESERLPLMEIPKAFQKEDLEKIVKPWKKRFDKIEGGYTGSPKFPLPNNWTFLLRYAVLAQDDFVAEHVHLTLQKMAQGGIFDPINGGFSRYSVDARWHVPHFEKMLYDNAQLMFLFSEAYQHQNSSLYKQTVEKIFGWLVREMTDENGGFYAAIDADSQGEEGKYYIFSEKEMGELFDEDNEFVKELYHIKTKGNWEEENTNVLFRDSETDRRLQKEYGLEESEFENKVEQINEKLLAYRKEQKPYPSVDKKKISSWNALMLKGLLKAYEVFGEEKYYDTALKNAHFICKYLLVDGVKLLHQKTDNNRSIPGFLDDYGACADAFISLYQVTFDEKWLAVAKQLCDTAIELFYVETEQEFIYSAETELIAQKVDIMDNVIPSSTSMLIRQLHKLSILYDKDEYTKITNQLLSNVLPHIHKYGSAYSNWCVLLLQKVYGLYEIALTGEKHFQFKREFSSYYIPNKIYLGGTKKNLPLLQDKDITKSKVYICKDRTCSLPQDTVASAVKLINANRG